MKKLLTRIRCSFEKRIILFKESDYDFLRLNLGTNSIFLSLTLFVCTIISFRSDVLNLNYLNWKVFKSQRAFMKSRRKK